MEKCYENGHKKLANRGLKLCWLSIGKSVINCDLFRRQIYESTVCLPRNTARFVARHLFGKWDLTCCAFVCTTWSLNCEMITDESNNHTLFAPTMHFTNFPQSYIRWHTGNLERWTKASGDWTTHCARRTGYFIQLSTNGHSKGWGLRIP